MEKRKLGNTGLNVTVLGYGAMALRGDGTEAGGVSDDAAGRVLNALLDGGVNFVDTAPDYGLSEERIGKFIARRRKDYYLATKCGCNVPGRDKPDAPKHVWNRDMLLHNIELSLQRLKTDYVDVWQLHNPSPEDVRAGELVRAMEDVKQQGKARHVSISSTLPHITAFVQGGAFATYQIPYSALQREEEGSITAAAKAGAGTIIRGGVAKGEPQTGLSENQRWLRWEQAGLDDLRGEDETRSMFLLRFTISHPHMHTTIVGTKDMAHLADNLRAAAKGVLPDKVYAEAKRRLDALG